MSDLVEDNTAEIGSIKISIVMGEEGLGTVFSIDGISRESAIGHIIVVLDRLREVASFSWADDDDKNCECPHCGADIHSDPDEDDDGV